MKKNASHEQGEGKNTRSEKKPFTKREKVMMGVVIFLIPLTAVFLLWEPVTNFFREKQTVSMLEKIEAGEPTILVDRSAFSISGEGYEVFVEPDGTTMSETVDQTATEERLPDELMLTALGTISIEKIDLSLPLFDSADIVPLRYGAGRLEKTALPGEQGNCVILGHRMKTYGSLFNRLDEVSVGDEVKIAAIDGTVYVYVVEEVIAKLEPTELEKYVTNDDLSGSRLTLVTCTPTGVGSHRIVIIATLQEA